MNKDYSKRLLAHKSRICSKVLFYHFIENNFENQILLLGYTRKMIVSYLSKERLRQFSSCTVLLNRESKKKKKIKKVL